jgi:PPOX class probable F420-dependent enzyme
MVRKIPADDPRVRYVAITTRVELPALTEFVAERHRWVLCTTRADGRPQMSPVTGGMGPDGRLLVSTYPSRAKARNIRRDPRVSVMVMGDEFNDTWVQVDGQGSVVDMPAAADLLVEYYRSISGEHPDWDEYRQAMADQGKSAIAITPTRWGPISSGGFPPELFED